MPRHMMSQPCKRRGGGGEGGPQEGKSSPVSGIDSLTSKHITAQLMSFMGRATRKQKLPDFASFGIALVRN